MKEGRERGSRGVVLVAAWTLAAAACSAPQKAPICDWEALGIEAPAGLESGDGATSDPGGPPEEPGTAIPDPYVDAARALLARGRVEEALDVLDHGVARFPGNAALLGLRGEARAESGFRRAAERDFLEALDNTPDDPVLWRRLGAVRLALDLPASANQALRRCSALAPDDLETVALLAKAAWDCGQVEKAWILYQRALARPEEAAAALLVEGAALYATPRIQERHPQGRALALGWLDRAHERDTLNARAHNVRGALLEAEGDAEGALEAYHAALATDPRCPGVSTNLALLLVERGEVELAAHHARRALEEERNPDLRRVLAEIAPESAAAPASAPRAPGPAVADLPAGIDADHLRAR